MSERTPREEYDWGLDSFVNQLDEVNLSIVYPHAFNNDDREVGGVLVGHKSTIGQLPLVYGAISAISADEQRATLTFTQDSWEHVHRVMEEKYRDGDIVGWYHTHPGFGIFLSEHDLFIHRNFFSDPSQIALVVDPIAGVEGVFTWQADDVEELYKRRCSPGWGPISLRDLERSGGENAEEGDS